MKKQIITAILVTVTGLAMAQTPNKVTISGKVIQLMGAKLDTVQNALANTNLPSNQVQAIIGKINEAVQPIYIAYRQRLAFEADSVAKSKKIGGKP